MNTPAPVALWVSPVSNLAGVARHILDVARHGLPGWRLVVAAPEGPLLDELRGLDIPVHTLDVDQPVHRAVADLRGIIKRLDPHIVHSHLAKADFLATMAAVESPWRATVLNPRAAASRATSQGCSGAMIVTS